MHNLTHTASHIRLFDFFAVNIRKETNFSRPIKKRNGKIKEECTLNSISSSFHGDHLINSFCRFSATDFILNTVVTILLKTILYDTLLSDNPFFLRETVKLQHKSKPETEIHVRGISRMKRVPILTV